MRTSEDSQEGCVKEPYSFVAATTGFFLEPSFTAHVCQTRSQTSKTSLVGASRPPSGVWVLETDDLILITSFRFSSLFFRVDHQLLPWEGPSEGSLSSSSVSTLAVVVVDPR